MEIYSDKAKDREWKLSGGGGVFIKMKTGSESWGSNAFSLGEWLRVRDKEGGKIIMWIEGKGEQTYDW